MKKLSLTLIGLLALTPIAQAAIITVNTENNADFSAGKTNLVRAITNAVDGDTIRFSIPPGAGETHYLQTPQDGYPLITKNNLTIDGYSQPGASPNSNPIHAANNAQIKICLSSTNGNALSMYSAVTNFAGHDFVRLGFGDDEQAVLGFFRATNVWVKGLAIIAAPTTATSITDGDCKSIAFCADNPELNTLRCQDWHVSGCWFGVNPETRTVQYMPDATEVATPTIAIAAYRTRGDTNSSNVNYPQPGTIGVGRGSANPRAEFNVFVTGYGFDSEGLNFKISGNFFNVLPDGMTAADMNVLNGGNQQGDGYIEIGRNTSSLVIGVGVNSPPAIAAEEGNVFCGFAAGSGVAMDLYGMSPGTNIVISGNYFGVAVDGVTRFPNSGTMVDSFAGSATVQFGSDFNGVNDALEGNVVYNNNPFAVLFPNPPGALENQLLLTSAGARISFRGNVTVNNDLLPFDYADGGGGRLASFSSSCNPFMDTSGSLIPILTGSTTATNHLTGLCPLGKGIFTNIILDVYIADPEGIANGQSFQMFEVGGINGYGFPQGQTYLASYVVDGPSDLDSTPGSFDFDIGSLHLPKGTQVTVTANYSADLPGTTQGRTHTSDFAAALDLAIEKVLTVTNLDNSQPGSFVDAINNLQNGFTIRFAFSGPGPFLIVPPPGGFPPITQSGVVIDGYSQAGAFPNTNSILSSNSAIVKVILDGKGSCFFNDVSSIDPGYANDDQPMLYVGGAACEIKGLGFVGPGQGAGCPSAHRLYGLGIGWKANSTHVDGCWFGLDPANPTAAGVHPFDAGVFESGAADSGSFLATNFPSGTVIGVNQRSGTAANARAQFNIFCGNNFNQFEGKDIRVSGNFFNVLPDGKHDLNQTAFPLKTMIGLGRGGNSWVIGTDGDGVNDAEERNIFGGVTVAADNTIIEFFGEDPNPGAARTNIVVAGNYFGLAVDGLTRFTNSMTVISNLPASGALQFGSDFNGVSDALEGNVVYMNNPFTTLFPTPGSSAPEPQLLAVAAGARISVRGNTMVNNGLVPFSYADRTGSRLTAFTNYEAPFFETASPIIPQLNVKSSTRHLIGTAAKAVGSYTNVIVDVYVEDPEGIANGQLFAFTQLSASSGFPQGKTYKGSFSLGNNFPGGAFDRNVTSLGVSPGDNVTIAVNYSADPPGTSRGRAHTSNFAVPVTLLAPLTVTSITKTGGTVTINWTGGAPPYTLQRTSPVTGLWGNVTTGILGTSTTDTPGLSEAYYRILY